jgi:proteasome lid subunit RPN8/RPN11
MRIGKITRYDGPRPVHLPIISSSKYPVIIIHKNVLSDIYNHANQETHHEVGGYLLGFPMEDPETKMKGTYIEKAVRAIYNSTPTFITLQPESFHAVESAREASDTILVGYYHSHPHLSVFFSGTDIRNFKDYHPESYQTAIVVDPTKTGPAHLAVRSDWLGFFGWAADMTFSQFPTENIITVETRPKVLTAAAIQSESNVRNQIANQIWVVNKLLQIHQHLFNISIPILIITEEVRNQLLSGNASLPEEGLLLGSEGNITGYNYITISNIYPLQVISPQKYKTYKKTLRKKAVKKIIDEFTVHLEGKQSFERIHPVGFYCTASILSQLGLNIWKNITGGRTIKKTKLIFKSSGNYHAVCIKEILPSETKIRVGMLNDKTLNIYDVGDQFILIQTGITNIDESI